MGQESEEALRIIIMLGQALVPPARSALMLTARAAAGAAKTATEAARDRLDGHGHLGHVRKASKLRGPLQSIDITDRLGREDICELNKICRRCGVGFAVTRIDTPQGAKTALQFEMGSASTLEFILKSAIGAGLLSADDVRDAVSPSPTGDGPVTYMGAEWSPAADGALEHPFTSAAGVDLTARANRDGSWSVVEDATGTVAIVGNEPLEGRAQEDLGQDLGGAIAEASGRVGALKSRDVMSAHAKMLASPEATASMRSSDLQRSAASLTERKKAAAAKRGPGRQPAPKPQRGIKR